MEWTNKKPDYWYDQINLKISGSIQSTNNHQNVQWTIWWSIWTLRWPRIMKKKTKNSTNPRPKVWLRDCSSGSSLSVSVSVSVSSAIFLRISDLLNCLGFVFFLFWPCGFSSTVWFGHVVSLWLAGLLYFLRYIFFSLLWLIHITHFGRMSNRFRPIKKNFVRRHFWPCGFSLTVWFGPCGFSLGPRFTVISEIVFFPFVVDSYYSFRTYE